METERMPFPMANVELVWQTIFEMLNDEDRICFANASPIWHGWVEKKLRPLLFAQVVPLLRPYVTADTLKDMRLVNSKCCNAIDNALASHPSNVWMDFEIAAQENKSIVPIQTLFTSSAEIFRFMDEMSLNTRNPFPSSSVAFVFEEGWDLVDMNYEADRIEDELWTACERLLERYGSFIKRVEFSNMFPTSINAYTVARFANCLSRMPNLKALVMVGDVEVTDRNVREYYYENNPLQLAHLESVTLNGIGQILTSCLLHYYCVPQKITRLSISGFLSSNLPHVVYRFGGLKVFKAKVHSHTFDWFADSGSMPPLREFYGCELLSVMWLRLFRSLQRFSQTLVKITLSGNFVVRKSECDMQMRLPNLKSLSFDTYHGSLDFLIQFTDLETLVIGEFYGAEFDGSLVAFNRIHVVDSNIWSLMPKLKTFRFREDTYKRPKALNV